MLRLRWVRTILLSLAFVWIMLAWHLHEWEERARRERMDAAITKACEGDPACEVHMRKNINLEVTRE